MLLEKMMNQTAEPNPVGVFKPVGHTLIGFHTDGELHSAVAALKQMGFAEDSMVQLSAAAMSAQVDAELSASTPLDNFGYELDLLRAHGALAQQGCSFLLVHAPSEVLSVQVANLVRSIHPATAQHYGRLLIEDLTERPPGRTGAQDAVQ